MRTSAWAYPLANVAHLFGLTLLAAGIVAIDLRILGLWRRLPLVPISAALTAVAVAGLVIFALSGAAMFAADAAALVKSPVFLGKMGVVGLALLNALVFRKRAGADLGHWDIQAPFWARASAAASLSLWSAAIICGRMIAYH